jgi:hypothetical protein
MNGTHMSTAFDYNNPSLPSVINGRNDPTSQNFAVGSDTYSHNLRLLLYKDMCPSPKVTMPTAPPFDLK